MSVVRLCSSGTSGGIPPELGELSRLAQDGSDSRLHTVEALTTAIFGIEVELLAGAQDGRRRFIRLLVEG